jgi:hypothetical protein
VKSQNINTMKSTQTPTPRGSRSKKARPLSRNRLQFGNLAMRYYKGKNYKTALRLFRKEIELTRGLLQALQDVGYRDNQRLLNKRQLEVIEEYLGEP